MSDIYYYNNEPLQLSYNNNYSLADKIEIIKQIEQDFNAGLLDSNKMRWIVKNAKFGSFTVQRIIDKLMFDGKLKVNPITLDARTFYKKPSDFDL